MEQPMSVEGFFMMKAQLQSKSYLGFLSLDSLFSFLGLVFILVFLLQFVFLYSQNSAFKISNQSNFNKLIAVSEYSVSSALSLRSGQLRRPNLIHLSLIDDSFISSLSKKTDLNLSVGDSASGSLCISRLIIDAQTLDYKLLKFCEGV